MNSTTKTLTLTLAAMMAAFFVQADDGQDLMELARAAQNPVADLIKAPFQYEIGFNAGPHNRVQHTLDFQPSVPLPMNEDWNFIWRTDVPLLVWPDGPNDRSVAGLGDLTMELLLSPSKPKRVPWGLGPIFTFPTGTRSATTTGKFGAGPSGAILTIQGPFVVGVQGNNVWSYSGWADKCVNQMQLQPFIYYNMTGGWYAVTSPIMTADWRASNDERWTVPLGAGVGRVMKVADQSVNVALHAYYNVEHPDLGEEYSVRIEFTLLYPNQR
jgi:hypothetical protein